MPALGMQVLNGWSGCNVSAASPPLAVALSAARTTSSSSPATWIFPLSIALGFWSGRALATGTAWAGLCLIHHHHTSARRLHIGPSAGLGGRTHVCIPLPPDRDGSSIERERALVFWALAGACQRHGVGFFLLCNCASSSSSSRERACGWAPVLG